MPRRRTGPFQLTAPPLSMGATGLPFRVGDIQTLAAKAGLAVRGDADPETLRQAMNWALLGAHHAAQIAQNAPPPGRTREAFKAVSSKGRGLLLALGLAGEPSDIARLDTTDIMKASNVLNALIRRSPVVLMQLLPSDVLRSYCSSTIPEEHQLSAAANRYAVEAARAVAFLVAYAEDARPQGCRRGPPRDAFTRHLFERLALVYFDTFGWWPALRRTVTGERDGPALQWLGEVLRLAAERLPDCEVTSKDGLAAALERSMANEPETQGSNFEKAVSRLRRRGQSPRG